MWKTYPRLLKFPQSRNIVHMVLVLVGASYQDVPLDGLNRLAAAEDGLAERLV